jgi:hypothetical protein
VKPDTVVAWHRAGFRLYWRWRSRPCGGRPKVTDAATILGTPAYGFSRGLLQGRRQLVAEHEIREPAQLSSKFRACFDIGISREPALGVFELAPPEVINADGIHCSDNRTCGPEIIRNYWAHHLKCGCSRAMTSSATSMLRRPGLVVSW